MRLLLISDLHLTSNTPIGRLDNVLETSIRKLKFVLDYAKDNRCTILQPGDFCNKSRDWKLLVKLMLLFRNYQDVEIFTIHGQHDYYYRTKNQFATMQFLSDYFSNIHMVEKPKEINDYLISPMSWGDKMPKPEKNMKNILLAHARIHPTKLYPNQEVTSHKKIRKLLEKWNLILIGDIHQDFYMGLQEGNYFVNTGPMMRLEATEYNIKHQPFFYVLDTYDGELEKIYIPAEPGDEVLSRKHIKDKEDVGEDAVDEIIEFMASNYNSIPTRNSIKKMLESAQVKKPVKKIIVETWNENRNS